MILSASAFVRLALPTGTMRVLQSRAVGQTVFRAHTWSLDAELLSASAGVEKGNP